MRVLMLVHSLRRGGAERVLLEIALGLKKRGHQVEVIAWVDVDEYQDSCYTSIKRHYLLKKEKYRWIKSIPSSAFILRKLVAKFNPDVIEIHTSNIVLVAACACLRIPCIHVLHGYSAITKYGTLKDHLICYLSRFASNILKVSYITVSESMIPVAAKYFNFNKSICTSVFNGVDFDKYIYKEKIPGTKPIILMLGTLCPNKGQALGICAFDRLLKLIPGAILLIVGDGVDRDYLNALVHERGLRGKINLLGTRNDVPDILDQTHILWQLSESEAMPMVALEAMASGVPVIGFDVRGTRDVIVDNNTGYLISYADVISVANTTGELLNDVLLYQRLALNSRVRVKELFDGECMVNGHEKLLNLKVSGIDIMCNPKT